MNKRWIIISICSLMLMSCNEDRVNMIGIYSELADKVHKGELEKVPSYLNENSKIYFDQITDPTKLSIEQVIELGLKYKVPYFSVMYFASCGDYMRSEGKPTDFFRYLANADISFFSKYNSYSVSEEKTKIGEEGFVAIYRSEGGVNRMSWAKFTRPDNKTFKYDLLYNLKLEEKRNREIYKEQRAEKKNLDMETFLKELYESYNNQNCDL